MKNKSIIVLSLIIVFIFSACSDTTVENEKSIVGYWLYEDTREHMKHFSEEIFFYEDGSFSSSTWREKCEGIYQIDGNEVIVKYDLYSNPAGSKVYGYEWSGVKTYELSGSILKLMKNVLDDGTVRNYEKEYVLKDRQNISRKNATVNSYRKYTGEETWNTIEISQRSEGGFYLRASCCNSSFNLGEFEGYFKYDTPYTASLKGKNTKGTEYKITAEFKGDSLLISVYSEESAEFVLFGFGMNC